MSEKILLKYFEESESAHQPIRATVGSAGYDLFAAQAMTLLPKCHGLSSKQIITSLSQFLLIVYGKFQKVTIVKFIRVQVW